MKASLITNDMDCKTGVIARKSGMSCFFAGDKLYPVTILEVPDNVVLSVKTVEKDGYNAVVVGAFDISISRVNKPQRHIFKDLSCAKRVVKEFVVSECNMLKLGDIVGVDIFEVGSKIDVSGVSIGKGFAGVMKRHNFRGLRASHGVSKAHRSLGSTGQCQDPGKVFKGKKMAGNMGGEMVTVHSLEIVEIRKNLLFVKGGVPGHKNAVLRVRNAVK